MTRPEISVLLLCARQFLSPPDEERLAAELRGGLDWGVFLELAVRHRVSSLVFHRLGRLPAGVVPRAVLENLRSISLGNLGWSLQAARALAGIMAGLEGLGVRAAAYKGPVLAVSAYGQPGLRSFNDLDIFVARDDLPRAFRFLEESGFSPEGGASSLLSHLTLGLLRDVVFRDRGGRLAVEVQWRIAQRYHPVFPRPDELLSRSVRVAVEGRPVLTFSAEDTLVVLCLHGLYHAWSRLQMIADVDRLIRNARVDWDLALGLARRNTAERILFLGVLLARNLLGTDLPATVSAAALGDRRAASMAFEVGRTLFEDRAPAAQARRLFFGEAALFPGSGSRLRYFIGRLTTPNEEDLAGRPLTWPRLFALPFKRLLRLFRTYALGEDRPGFGGG